MVPLASPATTYPRNRVMSAAPMLGRRLEATGEDLPLQVVVGLEHEARRELGAADVGEVDVQAHARVEVGERLQGVDERRAGELRARLAQGGHDRLRPDVGGLLVEVVEGV